MITYLQTVMRLPLRQGREVLRDLHGIEVSLGELVELLHRIKKYAQPVRDGLKAEIRASPSIQADETGWREDGINGYIWSVSTPTVRSSDLKKLSPYDEMLLTWAEEVNALYEQAVAWAQEPPDPSLSPHQLERLCVAPQHAFEQHLWKLCQPYDHTLASQHTLCERVE
jgi:transposase